MVTPRASAHVQLPTLTEHQTTALHGRPGPNMSLFLLNCSFAAGLESLIWYWMGRYSTR